MMGLLRIDMGGEFILMASMLMQIKAKMLLFYGYQEYPLIAVNEMRKMVDKIKMNLPAKKNIFQIMLL